nr:hypothetical protein CFP56_41779 [Quercus suber]
MRSVEAISDSTGSAQAQRTISYGLHQHLTATRSIKMERFLVQTTNLGLALWFGTAIIEGDSVVVAKALKCNEFGWRPTPIC